MKKLLVAIVLICVTFVNTAEKKYGKEITLKEKTSVSTILTSPEKFEGKTVLVEGKILNVCQKKGCWIEVAGVKKGEKIKVKDGEIVFPKNSKGKTALVEGVVAAAKTDECGKDDKDASCCSKDKDAKVSTEKKESGCSKAGEAACGSKDSKTSSCSQHKDTKASTDKKEKSCCSGEETVKAYQIQGLGAVIR